MEKNLNGKRITNCNECDLICKPDKHCFLPDWDPPADVKPEPEVLPPFRAGAESNAWVRVSATHWAGVHDKLERQRQNAKANGKRIEELQGRIRELESHREKMENAGEAVAKRMLELEEENERLKLQNNMQTTIINRQHKFDALEKRVGMAENALMGNISIRDKITDAVDALEKRVSAWGDQVADVELRLHNLESARDTGLDQGRGSTVSAGDVRGILADKPEVEEI